MEYRIEQAETGYYNAILKNPSFGWETVYTFTTESGALAFIEKKRIESAQALSQVVSITDYFEKVGA